MAGEGGSDTVGWKPVPDPTVLTTEALAREINSVRERLASEVAHVKENSAIKFMAIEQSFADVANRTAEQKTDTKDALDAALAAQKEAVSLQTEASDKAIAKSEAATSKQIDSLTVLQNKAGEDTADKINDLKARLDKLESSIQGTILTALVESRDKSDDRGGTDRAAIIAVVAVFVSILSILTAVGMAAFA